MCWFAIVVPLRAERFNDMTVLRPTSVGAREIIRYLDAAVPRPFKPPPRPKLPPRPTSMPRSPAVVTDSEAAFDDPTLPAVDMINPLTPADDPLSVPLSSDSDGISP